MDYLAANRIRAIKHTEPPAHFTRGGYGRKIPTLRMVQLTNNRWHRIYVCQISNAGTAYIIENNDWQVIGPEAEEVLYRLECEMV